MKKRLMTILGMAAACCVMMASAVWAGDNGTVTVNGQVWLKDAGCFARMPWKTAKTSVAFLAAGKCGLKDKSKAGDWRLPTLDELRNVYSSRSLFTNTHSDEGLGSGYWSSTPYGSSGETAYFVLMSTGGYNNSWGASGTCYVLPVHR